MDLLQELRWQLHLVSALTGKPIRREVGMTGEITLRGRVLPIGGLKEKSLGAHRAGLTKIIIPKDNEKDIDDIPESVQKGIRHLFLFPMWMKYWNMH